MKLSLENVRCFSGRHDVELSKITVLVGENSTGKSTFLAMLNAAIPDFKVTKVPTVRDFNCHPYNLGHFSTIATDKGGRGKAKYFAVGLDSPFGNYRAVYNSDKGQPALARLTIWTREVQLSIEHNMGVPAVTLTKQTGQKDVFTAHVPEEDSQLSLEEIATRVFWYFADESLSMEAQRLFRGLDRRKSRPPNKVSLAPIRTKPERTYDKAIADFTPEGDDMPFVLARGATDAAGRDLSSTLDRFGEDSGLFKRLEIKRLGKKEGDPFQLTVAPAGKARNITDVGYGVSQSLPVVVQSANSPKGTFLLLQQPEVHLHPRGQAALGSLFVDLAVRDGKTFVVETHSDQIVDRIRRCVARGKIPSSDVQILFFSREGHDAHIHPIQVSNDGSLIGAPPAYRSFFLEEETSLFLDS